MHQESIFVIIEVDQYLNGSSDGWKLILDGNLHLIGQLVGQRYAAVKTDVEDGGHQFDVQRGKLIEIGSPGESVVVDGHVVHFWEHHPFDRSQPPSKQIGLHVDREIERGPVDPIAGIDQIVDGLGSFHA